VTVGTGTGTGTKIGMEIEIVARMLEVTVNDGDHLLGSEDTTEVITTDADPGQEALVGEMAGVEKSTHQSLVDAWIYQIEYMSCI